MCLVLFGYKISDDYPLVLAANRDEFYARPTRGMHFWEDHPDILAGRDLEGGGTWFGITKGGRFAALTNFRDPSILKSDAPSRGGVIVDFLGSKTPCREYFEGFKSRAGRYNGFNLIFGDREGLYWFFSLSGEIARIKPGIHGVSNCRLDTGWPKVEKGKKALERAVKDSVSPGSLFPILLDTQQPADLELPDTGVGLEWERMLSPLFIKSDTYGTRSSTVVLMNKKGETRVIERTYDIRNPGSFADRDFCIGCC